MVVAAAYWCRHSERGNGVSASTQGSAKQRVGVCTLVPNPEHAEKELIFTGRKQLLFISHLLGAEDAGLS